MFSWHINQLMNFYNTDNIACCCPRFLYTIGNKTPANICVCIYIIYWRSVYKIILFIN